jgi:hypothetical protein
MIENADNRQRLLPASAAPTAQHQCRKLDGMKWISTTALLVRESGSIEAK